MNSTNNVCKYDKTLGYNTEHGNYKLSVISNKIFEIVDINPSNDILEVGCGSGELMIRLSRKTNRYVSTDISSHMITTSKNKSKNQKLKNTEFLISDALNLPFKDSSFDILIERNIPLIYDKRFIEDGTSLRFVRELKRCSRNKVVVIHQNNSFLNRNSNPNIHLFTCREIINLLQSAGLCDIKFAYVTHSAPFMYDIFSFFGWYNIELLLLKLPYICRLGGSIIASCSKIQ